MENKEKWYLNLYFICLLFAFSFLIIPLFLGVYLLNEKRKILYKEKIAFENTYRKLDETSLNYKNLQTKHLQLEDKYDKVIDRYSELDLNTLSDIKENIKHKNIEINDLNLKKSNLDTEYSSLENEVNILTKEKISISKEIHLLNNELEYIDLGFTKPLFDYDTSESFKTELLKTKSEQKKLVSSGKAIDAPKKMWLDGSLTKGKQRLKKDINNTLKTFNSDCDTIISKVKYNNLETIESRIKKSFSTLNKLNLDLEIKIKENYLNLKLKELHLTYGQKLKIQEENEAKRIEREILLEEKRLIKELEEKRLSIIKERTHYTNELNNLSHLLEKDPSNNDVLEKIKEFEIKIQEIENNLKDIDYRENNKRAGYVYIISNIGSFGENVFKIGMTRRLDPLDRVRELGDASVPFQFDVHALIFSEDAPSLENAIHKALENKKVNMKNSRKEFFNVTIEEIEKIVKENFSKTVEFIYKPEAEQYNQSLLIKKSKRN
uniref:DUF4041 domain-containing protein n=1 Tax=Gemella haemolysans TaxID=1379 RepID=UPI002931C0F3|nr:DUF4041 domain-containing protein [Gemella haemolysans]